MLSSSEQQTSNFPFQCQVCGRWFRHLVAGMCDACRHGAAARDTHGPACDCPDCSR